jgi:hypothetical protein
MQGIIEYVAEEVPVSGGYAEVTYDVLFDYNYDPGDHDTPPHTQVDAMQAEITEMEVYPDKERLVPQDNNREQIITDLENMLANGPAADIPDKWMSGSIQATQQQQKEALKYFWHRLANGDDLRETMIEYGRNRFRSR